MLAIALTLLLAQAAFFLRDRSPQTWDPSLQVHLAYRLSDRIASEGPSAALRTWTTAESLYPPLYPAVHLGLAFARAPVAWFRYAQSLLLVLLVAVVHRATVRRHGALPASAAAALLAGSPLLLGLSRTTYIENLLLPLIALALVRLRRDGLPGSSRAAVLDGLLAGACLLTKWSALVVLAPAAIAAAVVGRSVERRPLRPGPVALATGIAAFLSLPWYLSGGARLLDKLTWQATEKPGAASDPWTLASLTLYPRALVSEVLWLPVGLISLAAVALAARAIDRTADRFWTITLGGALVVLLASPHKQPRFLALVLPGLALLLGEALGALAPTRRAALSSALLALSGAPLLALSLPLARPVGVEPPTALSPAHGIPSLRFGPPDPTPWPHGELLRALRENPVLGLGPTDRIAFRGETRHPYLNRWTFRAEGWPLGLRFTDIAGRAKALVEIDPETRPSDARLLASAISPDGHRCVVRLRASVHDPTDPDP